MGAVVVNGDDVGVVEPGGGLGLATEEIDERRAVGRASVLEPFRRNELDRHVAAKLAIAGLMDDAEAAPAERPDDLHDGQDRDDQ